MRLLFRNLEAAGHPFMIASNPDAWDIKNIFQARFLLKQRACFGNVQSTSSDWGLN